MGNVSKDEVSELLAPYNEHIYHAVHGAWEKLINSILPMFPACTVRYRRNAMYELMIQMARPLFHDLSGIELVESKRGRILLVVNRRDANLVVRFKKIDNKFLTSNYPTQGSLAFDHQMPGLPGIPSGSRITVGYLMNDDETQLIGVFIIFAKGTSVQWQYELLPNGKTAEIYAFPQPALPMQPKKTKPHVQAKKKRIRRKTGHKNNLRIVNKKKDE